MKELLSKVSEVLNGSTELFGLVQNKNKEADLKLAKAAVIEESNAKERIELNAKHEELNKREAAVSKIENIAQFQKDAEALNNKVRMAQSKLENDVAAFNKMQAEALNKIAHDTKANESESARLDALEQSLKAEKVNLKYNTLKEMTDKMGK